MKTEKQIQDVLSLYREKVSIRKIADRLNMSPTTVHKYIKTAFSVEEVQPALKIETTDVTASSGNATTNNEGIEWTKLYRDQPLGSIRVRGMPSSEFPDTFDQLQNNSNNRDDRPPRRRGISFDQSYMGPDYYSEDLNYCDQYGAPRRPDIPVPRVKYGTLETSIVQIKKDYNDQKQKREIESLEKKIDRQIKLARADREREKKLQKETTRKLPSTENNQNPEIHRNYQVPTCQNIENQIVHKPAVTEVTGKASIEIKDEESESREGDVMPWVGACLEIAVDSGVFDYIGRKTGEWIFKPNKPTRGILREIKKSSRQNFSFLSIF